MTRTIGSRVGTNSPTDLFNLMSEHLKIAKKGGSFTLQRRLLSAVMGEVRAHASGTTADFCQGHSLPPLPLPSAQVVFYAQQVLTDLMAWWGKEPASVDMDYVTAVINDAGEGRRPALLLRLPLPPPASPGSNRPPAPLQASCSTTWSSSNRTLARRCAQRRRGSRGLSGTRP